MSLFDKVKNLFTEEIEEEPIVRSEPKQVVKEEIKPVIKEEIKPIVKEEIKPTREEKFVYFTDDDFKDLEKPKVEVKKEEPKKPMYKGTMFKKEEEPKKEFKPSPIISPVYGVLDKNYDKEDIKAKPKAVITRPVATTVDDIRNKAFGTVEDTIKDDILGKTVEIKLEQEVIEPEIDVFEGLDDIPVEKPKRHNVDEIFGKLNDKKEEILDELDDKKEEILDELDEKKDDILKKDDFVNLTDDIEIPDEEEEEVKVSDVDVAKELLEDDETLALAKELEEQKKKLAEINDMMDENEKIVKTKTKTKKKEEKEDELNESELFDLIDSSFDTEDDE